MQHEETRPIQRFLLRELAASRDELATETLIGLVESEGVPDDLLPEVRAALAARTSGASSMLAALARRHDFLEGVERAGPVGPLADALAAMGEARAAPLLADHLLDPATPAEDVERAAAALAVLARPEEAPALRQLFAMYRSEEDEAPLVQAVAHAARGLVRLGLGDVVKEALSDPYTSEAVRSKLAAPAR